MWWEICWLFIWKKANKKREQHIKKYFIYSSCLLKFYNFILFHFNVNVFFPKIITEIKCLHKNDKVNNYLGKWTSKSDVVSSLNVKLNYFVWNVFLPRQGETNRTKKHTTMKYYDVFTQPTGNTAPFFLFFTLKLNILKCISLNMRVVFWSISKKKREILSHCSMQ